MTPEQKEKMRQGRLAKPVKSIPCVKAIDSANTNQARQQKLIDWLSENHPTQKALFQKVFFGKPSKSSALKAKCLECCNHQRAEVAACSIASCPLWRFRPFQGKDQE